MATNVAYSVLIFGSSGPNSSIASGPTGRTRCAPAMRHVGAGDVRIVDAFAVQQLADRAELDVGEAPGEDRVNSRAARG
jgi:hypothetical protein